MVVQLLTAFVALTNPGNTVSGKKNQFSSQTRRETEELKTLSYTAKGEAPPYLKTTSADVSGSGTQNPTLKLALTGDCRKLDPKGLRGLIDSITADPYPPTVGSTKRKSVGLATYRNYVVGVKGCKVSFEFYEDKSKTCDSPTSKETRIIPVENPGSYISLTLKETTIKKLYEKFKNKSNKRIFPMPPIKEAIETFKAKLREENYICAPTMPCPSSSTPNKKNCPPTPIDELLGEIRDVVKLVSNVEKQVGFFLSLDRATDFMVNKAEPFNSHMCHNCSEDFIKAANIINKIHLLKGHNKKYIFNAFKKDVSNFKTESKLNDLEKDINKELEENNIKLTAYDSGKGGFWDNVEKFIENETPLEQIADPLIQKVIKVIYLRQEIPYTSHLKQLLLES
ncbi:hypothetical protein DID73_01035 [Candidatus Marinamargulisbacteria bacterium SCGC AG-343-K17]|nr:hypothetical protein DID73_01035 [Candidatus Marinamargulisbacteria bacterium SCGC AG-343-K17]